MQLRKLDSKQSQNKKKEIYNKEEEVDEEERIVKRVRTENGELSMECGVLEIDKQPQIR